MKPIKIFFDKIGNALNVWFDDPEKESVSEETSEEIILIKDNDSSPLEANCALKGRSISPLAIIGELSGLKIQAKA